MRRYVDSDAAVTCAMKWLRKLVKKRQDDRARRTKSAAPEAATAG